MDNRLTTKMLIQFIKKNLSGINKINKINLNNLESTDDEIDNTNQISPLNHQKSEQINFLPRNLREWFNIDNEQYYHLGVLEYFEPKNVDYDINISLFTSILTCLTSSFSQQSSKNQSEIVHNLILRLKKDAKKKFYDFDYKNKETSFNHHDLINDLNNGNYGGNLIRYIADYFHINLFILDVEEDEFVFGNIKKFVPFKKTIFVIKFNQHKYEPVFTNKSKYFSFKDDLIEIIIDNITDIDNEIEVLTDENLEKYIVKPLTMTFSEKKLLIEVKKQEYKDRIKKQLREENIKLEKKTKSNVVEDSDSEEEKTKSNVVEDSDSSSDEEEKKTKSNVVEDSDSEEEKKPNIIQDDSSSDESTFEEDIYDTESSDEEPLQDYSKMKLEELKNIAKKLKISLINEGKPKTKALILKDIDKKMKK